MRPRTPNKPDPATPGRPAGDEVISVITWVERAKSKGERLSNRNTVRIWTEAASASPCLGLAEHNGFIAREARLATWWGRGRFVGVDRVAPKGVTCPYERVWVPDPLRSRCGRLVVYQGSGIVARVNTSTIL
jgi:hypothetical protein